MKVQFYTADVFTTEVFSGAQIAVFPNTDKLTNDQILSIADEFFIGDVAFISASGNNNHHKIRIFSKGKEINFASHTTVAAAHVLASIDGIKLSGDNTPFLFESNVGNIDGAIISKSGQPTIAQFSTTIQPAVDAYVPTNEEIATILGVEVDDIEGGSLKPLLVSCDTPYFIVPLKSPAAVQKAKYNYSAWAQSTAPSMLAQEILLFTASTDNSDADYYARLLGPDILASEDPPIGAAVPAFVGYLGGQTHQSGSHSFVAQRGTNDSRISLLNIEMEHLKNKEISIRVGGSAVMVSEGSINIP